MLATAGRVQAGAPARPERTATDNRLLVFVEELGARARWESPFRRAS